MLQTQLPNGKQIYCLRKQEVDIIGQQIDEYFSHGIELFEGAIVFDVGANIGLFSLSICEQLNSVTVYAFEPIPAIFDVLSANVSRFYPENIIPFPYGLAQESKQTTFAYHPKATALSNAYPENSKQEKYKLTDSILRNFKDGPGYVPLLRWVPSFLRPRFVNKRLSPLFEVESVTCQMKTISQMIRDQGIPRIDLLKVDVERSELDVVLGIETQDWPKIKQIVIEIHDLEDRVKQITTLFRKHGFTKITLEQEPLFQGSDIFNVYACR